MIEVVGVSKDGGRPGDSDLFENLNLKVARSEVVSLRGENGSGKTTLLRVLAGLAPVSSGKVVRGRSVSKIGYVPQDYRASLLQWMSIGDNVSLPLRLEGISRREREARVEEVLGQLGFVDLPIRALPRSLSGGQQQMVAIARSLISKPEILLLDEPFASLDSAATREAQSGILRYQESSRATIVLISHDIDTSILLADRLILIGSRPVKVIADIPVRLPKPRNNRLLLSERFLEVRAELIAAERPEVNA